MKLRHLAMAAACLAFAAACRAVGRRAAAPAQSDQQTASLNVERLFATSCGWCHQNGGRTEGRGPKLAGTDKSDTYIIDQIKNGKPPGMPSFGRSFNDEQVRAILAYIRGLKDEP